MGWVIYTPVYKSINICLSHGVSMSVSLSRNNLEVRQETKFKIGRTLEMGQMDIEQLASQMSFWNNWRKQTNMRIIKEMVEANVLGQKANIVFLEEKWRGKFS